MTQRPGTGPEGGARGIRRALLSIRRGSLSGASTCWTLVKVMIPTMVVVQLLRMTGLLDQMASLGAPLMTIFHLPGESALVLITGALVNIYAAIAVAVNIPLTAKGMTILAIMVLIAHNLIVETAVQSQSGTPAVVTLPVRIFTALAAGLSFTWIIPENGQLIIRTGMTAAEDSWRGIWIANGVSILKIMVIVMSLMVIMDLGREYGVLDRITNIISVPMKYLGLEKRTSLVTAVGLLLGLAYGAGLIIGETRKNGINRNEILATNIFLGTNHALIEDTLIFVAVGAGLGWILVGRLLIGSLILKVALPVVLYFWKPMEASTG